MDRSTRAKIDSLLHELRSWGEGAAPPKVDELARRYQLDPMIIRRLLEDEGIAADEGEAQSEGQAVDEHKVTTHFDPAVIAEARARAANEDPDT